jgi:hypothetical protein
MLYGLFQLLVVLTFGLKSIEDGFPDVNRILRRLNGQENG